MNISGKQGVINGETKVLGIIGEPLEHTLSPSMHNPAYKKEGLNFAIYLSASPVKICRRRSAPFVLWV